MDPLLAPVCRTFLNQLAWKISYHILFRGAHLPLVCINGIHFFKCRTKQVCWWWYIYCVQGVIIGLQFDSKGDSFASCAENECVKVKWFTVTFPSSHDLTTVVLFSSPPPPHKHRLVKLSLHCCTCFTSIGKKVQGCEVLSNCRQVCYWLILNCLFCFWAQIWYEVDEAVLLRQTIEPQNSEISCFKWFSRSTMDDMCSFIAM